MYKFESHRHYRADASSNSQKISDQAYRALELADVATCVASGQLKMLAEVLERQCGSPEERDPNIIHAAADTLNAISEDLKATKEAIEIGLLLIERGTE